MVLSLLLLFSVSSFFLQEVPCKYIGLRAALSLIVKRLPGVTREPFNLWGWREWIVGVCGDCNIVGCY